jgi:uracil-DNA glycosylase family 4
VGRKSDREGWERLRRRIVGCKRCPRLVAHTREIARLKRRAYRDETYWGRPVPGFGDTRGKILVLGLAPAAHGANRTGRMFTGDSSGDWLYGALHRAGLANRPDSVRGDDGLRLRGVFITATCRCAPPANKPTTEEMGHCAPFLDCEFDLLNRLQVVVALGKIAWDAALRRVARVAPGSLPRPRPAFGHDTRVRLPLRRAADPIWLLGSYHPSRQNTQTGRLTGPMLDRVIGHAARLAGEEPGPVRGATT